MLSPRGTSGVLRWIFPEDSLIFLRKEVAKISFPVNLEFLFPPPHPDKNTDLHYSFLPRSRACASSRSDLAPIFL